MLKAPQELLRVDREILKDIFAMASFIDDDDDIKENVLWL